MFSSPLLVIPVAVLLVVLALFATLAWYVRPALRGKAYSPEEFAMLLRDIGELPAAANRLSDPNNQELRPNVRPLGARARSRADAA